MQRFSPGSSLRAHSRRLSIEPLEPRQLLAITTVVAEADTYTQAGVGAGSATVLDALDTNGNGDSTVYVRFDISGVDLGAMKSATLKLYKTAGSRNDTIVEPRFDVYGLLSLVGNTPQDWDEATLAEENVGAEYTNVLGDGLDTSVLFNLDEESGANVSETVFNANDVAQELAGADLMTFLESRQADNGLVTFVHYIDAGNFRGWGYHSREAATSALWPVLEFDDGETISDAYPDDPIVLPRQVEKLDRGVVAVHPTASTAYIGWRMLGSDPADVAFNIYRSTDGGVAVKLNDSPLTETTDYVDNSASTSGEHTYHVRAVINGIEQEPSKSYTLAASSPVQQHVDVPLQVPDDAVIVLPSGTETPPPNQDDSPHQPIQSYSANDASVGDLDGDGDYEVIVKWEPSYSQDPSREGLTGNVLLDAYDLEDGLLWRIDLGRNIRAGAHTTPFVVYDFDGDGRSEVAMMTAPGTIAGDGQFVLLPGDNADDDYRDGYTGSGDGRWGRVIGAPEYLTVFDGLTGAELDTVAFEPALESVSSWGDSWGNRKDRLLVAPAYLDGNRPSMVWARGYAGPSGGFNARNEVAAFDYRDGQLSSRWIFEAATNGENPGYVGQTAHSITVGDVDGDGKDEVITGAAALDDDGTLLYNTGLGHGDALHLSDMDPNNPGLELFMPHESQGAYESNGRDAGGEYRDAQTGELLTQIPSNNDVGRGVAMDIDPNHEGYEFWASTNQGTRMIYNVSGQPLYATPSNMMYNFGIWWDADLSRELLDGTTISEWNNPGRSNLVSFGSSGINSTSGLSSNNGSKSTPSLTADVFGDWREEVIWRRSDNSALEIWTTSIPASSRLTTLMHDTQYRVAVAWQNSGYNQPPHPSYWIGQGMDTPPQPLIYFGGELQGDYNGDGAVGISDYTVWRNSLGSTQDLAADGDHSGTVDAADYDVWKSNFGATTPSPAALVSGVSSPLMAGASEESLAPEGNNDTLGAAFASLDQKANADRDPAIAQSKESTGQSDAAALLLLRRSAQAKDGPNAADWNASNSDEELNSPMEAALDAFWAKLAVGWLREEF